MRVTVLGSAQDGGLPQAGSTHPHDEDARSGTMPERTGPSLLVEDGGARLVCDVSPDFRLQWWPRTGLPDAVALTHAHVGHYSGLVHFGKEAAAATAVELHASARMLDFLAGNAPWGALLDDRHVVPADDPTWAGHRVDLIPVPHRAEFTDTVSISIGEAVLWLPDIDDWSSWPEAASVVARHRVAFLDATFWSDTELAERSQIDVPHPLVPDTIRRFKGLPTRMILTHLNHTNPLVDPTSDEAAIVREAGFEVAHDGMTIVL